VEEGGEVIIGMSGVFTPQILQLSGIGPKEELEKLGIKVWVDNPNVGKHLQSNHVAQGAVEYPSADYGNALTVGATQNQYALNGTGPYSHPDQYAYAYVCSTPTKHCTNPDVMLGTQAGGFQGNNIPPGTKTLSTQVSTSTPKDRGTVRLISKSPFDLVNVTQGTWTHPEDLQAQLWGWKEIRKWLATPPISSLLGRELVPGTSTDAELITWIKANAGAVWHWVGTAKFGNEGDSTRVTDPQLRVVGMKNLRVGDGSVYPSVNSHLQASAAAAGERVADFILNGN